MLKRLLRSLVGIILFSTIIITIIPFLLAWIITGRNFLAGILNYIVYGNYIEDLEE